MAKLTLSLDALNPAHTAALAALLGSGQFERLRARGAHVVLATDDQAAAAPVGEPPSARTDILAAWIFERYLEGAAEFDAAVARLQEHQIYDLAVHFGARRILMPNRADAIRLLEVALWRTSFSPAE